MLLEVFLVFPLYAISFWIFWRIRHIIKAMSECFDQVDTPKEAQMRFRLQRLIEEGKGPPGYTLEKLEKASDATIAKLFGCIPSKSFMSKATGVKDFEAMMGDIARNPLTSRRSQPASRSTYSQTEVLGSHVYERLGSFLGPISLFCIIFNHLDWELYAEISKEREASALNEWDIEEIEKKDGELFE